MAVAPETRVPPPLPLTVGSRVARLAEALHVGALADTTDSETATTTGEREGAGTSLMWCWVVSYLVWTAGTSGRRVGLGPRTRCTPQHQTRALTWASLVPSS